MFGFIFYERARTVLNLGKNKSEKYEKVFQNNTDLLNAKELEVFIRYGFVNLDDILA